MKPTRRTIRRLAATVAALSFCMAVWYPDRVEPQTTDLVALGRQALDANRVDEAIAIFEKAGAADPKNPAALAWLGSAQVQKAREASIFQKPGWVKRGFNTLDQAVERFPDAFIGYMVRGITATRVPDMFNKAPLAVQDLTTVLAMREKDPGAVPENVMPGVYLHLGIAYKKNGQTAEARAAWEKAKKAYPSAPETQTIEKELRDL